MHACSIVATYDFQLRLLLRLSYKPLYCGNMQTNAINEPIVAAMQLHILQIQILQYCSAIMVVDHNLNDPYVPSIIFT